MKWWPGQCTPGDMIRVRLGSIYHYGVFVSEDEVIQFGPPPVAGFDPQGDIRVCVTDMETFCCGTIAETALLDRRESKRRIPPARTVELARSRLGEGGYNLIHNNCEHFANQCVFGIRRSEQEEEARRRWNARPICDVYVAAVPDDLTVEPLWPPRREQIVAETAHEDLKKQRFLAWKVLEYAAQRTFHLDWKDLTFREDRFGKWTCDRFFFSISHTPGMVAVAISNSPVGVDVEHIPSFMEKFAPRTGEMFRKIAVGQECQACSGDDPAALLELWCRKESLFKCSGEGKFDPLKTDTTGRPLSGCVLTAPGHVYLSLCGEKAHRPRYYLYENQSAHLLSSELRTDRIEL